MNTMTDTAAAIEAIQALDLEPIKRRALQHEGGRAWSAEHVERVADFYRKFLILHVRHPQAVLVPDADTDEFWHLHVLDTRKYVSDCDRLFGGYLHHTPHMGERTAEDAERHDEGFEATKRLYVEEFGAPAAGEVPWHLQAAQPAWSALTPPTTRAAWSALTPPTARAAWSALTPPPARREALATA
jgi:hypothetical protein